MQWKNSLIESYISGLWEYGKQVPGLASVIISMRQSATVTDLVDGSCVRYDYPFAIPPRVFGCADYLSGNTRIFAAHNEMSLKFHSFVESAEHGWTSAIYDNAGSDFVRLEALRVHDRRINGTEKIIVDTCSEEIGVYGENGGVCFRDMKPGREELTTMTLPDLLLSLGRETGVDLLRYHLIVIGSEQRQTMSVVRLSQSKEASRFYQKMRLLR